MVVVRKNLNLSLNDNVFSPKVIVRDEPLLTIYYKRIGSKEGSKSFPTFSINTYLPNYTANSRVLIRFGSLTFNTSIPSACSLPIFLINLFA